MVRGLTKAEKTRLAAERKEAEATFLAFHDNSSWAVDKVRSGTAALTPEAVHFMKLEITRRADVKAHAADLDKQIEAADLAARIAANGT